MNRGRASQVVILVKNLPASATDIRDVGSIPGSGRFPGGQHSNPLQYSEEDTIFRVYNIQRSIQRSIQCMEGA